jgi:hypothetical protein
VYGGLSKVVTSVASLRMLAGRYNRRREGPILDENQSLRIIDIAASWIREPGSLFTCIQADCWSDANAVSPRHFVVLSVKNKFA